MCFEVHRYIMQGRLSKAITEAQRKGFRNTEEDVPKPSWDTQKARRAATWASCGRLSSILTPERGVPHLINMH